MPFIEHLLCYWDLIEVTYLLGAYSLLGTVLRAGGAISIFELFDFSTALDALYHYYNCIDIECKVQIFPASKWERKDMNPRLDRLSKS